MKLLRNKLVTVGAVIVLVAIGVVAYIVVHNKNAPKVRQSKPGVVSITKKSPTQPGVSISVNDASGDQAAKSSTTNGGSPGTSAPANVTTPSGSFVSNHHATLSAPANVMNSVCQTTVGVTCQINFTQGGTVKTLGPNTVGSDGNISWDWKLQDIGLTTGSWQVQAIAKSGSQSVSTNDPMPLEISP